MEREIPNLFASDLRFNPDQSVYKESPAAAAAMAGYGPKFRFHQRSILYSRSARTMHHNNTYTTTVLYALSSAADQRPPRPIATSPIRLRAKNFIAPEQFTVVTQVYVQRCAPKN